MKNSYTKGNDKSTKREILLKDIFLMFQLIDLNILMNQLLILSQIIKLYMMMEKLKKIL